MAINDLRNGVSLMDASDLEQIATNLHQQANGTGVESLAAVIACNIRHLSSMPPELESITLPNGTIVVRPGDERESELMALHEIAHRLLQEEIYSPNDAWRLTLALGMPLPFSLDSHKKAALPAWAIDARLSMPVVMATTRAAKGT